MENVTAITGNETDVNNSNTANDEYDENTQLLIAFCKNFYKMLGLSVRVYNKGELIKRYQISEMTTPVGDYFENMLFNLVENSTETYLKSLSSGNLLVCGVAVNAESGLSVVLGPVRTDVITDNQLNKISSLDGSTQKTSEDAFSYLNMLPIMNTERFCGFFNMLNIYMNKELKQFPIPVIDKHEIDLKTVTGNLIDYREKLCFQDAQSDNITESERRIIFYVKNGMYEQIKDLMQNSPLHKEKTDNSYVTLRQEKNSVILGIGLVSRAAISVGMDPDKAYYLVRVFTDKTEFCRNVDDLIELRYKMLLLFTEQVHELNMIKSKNPLINRIIRYIDKNIETKITCDDIAKMCNVNSTYVSTCFKKETGIGLVDYINRQKITKAKMLLKFTDKSLVQITYYLSFCTQAYFSKLFKDIVGMTPQEYRDSEND